MEKNEKFVNDKLAALEAQLEQWGDKLNVVLHKANVAGQQAKIESREQIVELKAKLAAARKTLETAKAAGGEKWETFKQGLDSTWQEIEGTFKKLMH